MSEKYKSRLRALYEDEIKPALKNELNVGVMAVPKIEKIVVNMGLGEAIANKKILEDAVKELTAIAGQKPVVNKARKSIATFKLREGMHDFLDHLINIALPRVKDFKGVSGKGFDGRGNYTLGIKEFFIFPEIDFNKVEKSKGFNITIVTTATNDKDAKLLLKKFNMPFNS